ncbi:porin family protein [Marilutibacter alkalisoli]|nr:porin family protein [Lysobacter alkalisoli]
MKKTLALSLVLALGGLTGTALAANGSGTFVRGEVGNSDIEIGGFDGSDTALSLRGGYYFNSNVAVEAFYSNLGKDSDDSVRAKIHGFGLGVVGKRNFIDPHHGFFISGRAGVMHTTTDISVSGLGSADDSSSKPYVGIGIGYDFSPAFGLGLNYDFIKAEAFDTNIDIQTVTLGLEMRF